MPAVNPLRGEVALDAGERGTLKVCIDVNALCYAEERLGKTTDEIAELVTNEFADWGTAKVNGSPRINVSLARTLLWAGLQRDQPGTHMAEVGEIMTEAGLVPSINAVISGFFAAFGKAEDGEDANPPAKPRRAARGTG